MKVDQWSFLACLREHGSATYRGFPIYSSSVFGPNGSYRDYIYGSINTRIYVQPALQSGDASAVAFNSLLNSGIWSGGEVF